MRTRTGVIREMKADVSRNDRQREELRTRKQQYKRIFEFSPQVIGVVDIKGNVLDVNKRVSDWLGYKPKDVIGKRSHAAGDSSPGEE